MAPRTSASRSASTTTSVTPNQSAAYDAALVSNVVTRRRVRLTFDEEEKVILSAFERKWREAPTAAERRNILFCEILNPMFEYKTCGRTKLMDNAAACDYAEDIKYYLNNTFRRQSAVQKSWSDKFYTRRKVACRLFRDRIDFMIEQLYLDDVRSYEDWHSDDDQEDMTPPGSPPLAGQAGWIAYYTRAAKIVLESLSPEDEEVVVAHRDKWMHEGLPREEQAANADRYLWQRIKADMSAWYRGMGCISAAVVHFPTLAETKGSEKADSPYNVAWVDYTDTLTGLKNVQFETWHVQHVQEVLGLWSIHGDRHQELLHGRTTSGLPREDVQRHLEIAHDATGWPIVPPAPADGVEDTSEARTMIIKFISRHYELASSRKRSLQVPWGRLSGQNHPWKEFIAAKYLPQNFTFVCPMTNLRKEKVFELLSFWRELQRKGGAKSAFRFHHVLDKRIDGNLMRANYQLSPPGMPGDINAAHVVPRPAETAPPRRRRHQVPDDSESDHPLSDPPSPAPNQRSGNLSEEEEIPDNTLAALGLDPRGINLIDQRSGYETQMASRKRRALEDDEDENPTPVQGGEASEGERSDSNGERSKEEVSYGVGRRKPKQDYRKILGMRSRNSTKGTGVGEKTRSQTSRKRARQ